MLVETDCVQIPSEPLPVAAVEPACGDVRLGRASPLKTGAGVGAAGATAGVLADWWVGVPLSPPPPPPHAASVIEPSIETSRSDFDFIFILFVQSADSQCRKMIGWISIYPAQNRAILYTAVKEKSLTLTEELLFDNADLTKIVFCDSRRHWHEAYYSKRMERTRAKYEYVYEYQRRGAGESLAMADAPCRHTGKSRNETGALVKCPLILLLP
ncbi:hypothetical protein PQR67_20175 [Paraburkholderia fungorum]|uniref:hypothetical protein n=1 Tax=Paraburkholderia fungorum TaxID=134537 RepID=UPI0038BDC969